MKPGPETDRKVAEAAGIEGALRPIAALETPQRTQFWRYVDDKTSVIFSPSTNLNAAFAAAEKVGLFAWQEFNGRTRYAILRKLGDEYWDVGTIIEENPDEDCWLEGRGDEEIVRVEEQGTPALAICAAILELKG